MTHSEFIQLVQDMRSAQKNYFRNRGNRAEASIYLQKALKLEAEVDHALFNIDQNCTHQTLQFHQTRLDANTTPIHNTPQGE